MYVHICSNSFASLIHYHKSGLRKFGLFSAFWRRSSTLTIVFLNSGDYITSIIQNKSSLRGASAVYARVAGACRADKWWPISCAAAENCGAYGPRPHIRWPRAPGIGRVYFGPHFVRKYTGFGGDENMAFGWATPTYLPIFTQNCANIGLTGYTLASRIFTFLIEDFL